jgi:hypothetical protein
MANSYVNYTATAGQTVFSGVVFPGGPALASSHINAFVNGTQRSCTVSGSLSAPTVTLATAASAGDIVRIARSTPATASTRVVDFTDGDVLTASDLDAALLNSLYAAQEAQDTGGGALPYDAVIGAYDSGNKRVINVLTPTGSNDVANKTYVDSKVSTAIATAVTLSGSNYTASNKIIADVSTPQNVNDAVNKAYVDALSVYGGAAVSPQSWTYALAASDWTDLGGSVDPASRYKVTKQLSGLLSYDANSLIVSFGGVLQTPGNAYSLSNDQLSLYAAAATAGRLTVRNFGVSRSAFSPATASTLGSVKVGNNITVQPDGTISTATLSTVATSGAYSDLSGKPTLGTASALDVPASGNASTAQVVKGTDTRLTDSRTPTTHTHAISDVTNLQTSLDVKMAIAGGAFSGQPTYAADPVNANDLTRKQWVDTQLANKVSYQSTSNAIGTINFFKVSIDVNRNVTFTQTAFGLTGKNQSSGSNVCCVQATVGTWAVIALTGSGAAGGLYTVTTTTLAPAATDTVWGIAIRTA